MGQYYKVVNLDKKQYLDPHDCGEGAKLMEIALSSMSMMSCVALLLADGNGRGGGDIHSENPLIGSWAGDRIVISGDYADNGRFIPEDQGPLEWGGEVHDEYNLNALADEDYGWENVSLKAMRCLAEDAYVRKTFESREKTGWGSERYTEFLKASDE